METKQIRAASRRRRSHRPAGRTVGALAVVVGMVLSATLALASPARAFAAETFRNAATGNCLDGNGSGDIYPLACNGGAFQHWEVVANGDGSRTFRNSATGLCLDNNDSQAVYGHQCNGGTFQKWWISRAYGEIGFENKQTGRCLRDIGNDIAAPRRGWQTCAVASSRQRWN
jgi:hypothetical protein